MKYFIVGFTFLSFALAANGQKNLMDNFNGDFETHDFSAWRFPEIGGAGNGYFDLSDDSYEGNNAVEVFWPYDTDHTELVFDTWSAGIPVKGESTYIFRWAAYCMEGGAPNFAVTLGFFDIDGHVVSESGGQFPVGNFYEEFEYVGIAAPSATTCWIAFRLFGADGSRWPIEDKTIMIDNVQLWENYNSTEVKANFSSQLRLYPNPVKNNLTIISENAIKQIKIYSIEGQLVKVISKNVSTINLSALTSGIYIVRIESRNGYFTKKIFKY